MNSLSWCGQAAPPGINYDTCSDPKGCNENNSYDFWGKMSTWVRAMINLFGQISKGLSQSD